MEEEGDEERAHILEFLKWVALCRRVERVCEQHMDFIEYRGYQLWRLVSNHYAHQPATRDVLRSIHEQCPRQQGGGACRALRLEDERAIMNVSRHMTEDYAYYAEIVERFSDVSSSDEDKALPPVVSHRAAHALIGMRAKMGTRLCGRYMARAVWREHLGREPLTLLEAFLVTDGGLRQLGLEHERPALARLRMCVVAHNAPAVCRGCFALARRVAHPLQCTACHQMHFCSPRCKAEHPHAGTAECALLIQHAIRPAHRVQ